MSPASPPRDSRPRSIMATNGTVATTPANNPPDALPPATVDSAAHKRKHEHVDPIPTEPSTLSVPLAPQVQRDLLAVLERHDTTPSLLRHVLDDVTPVSATENEPPSKKSRTSETDTPAHSIAEKLANTSYESYQQIATDANRAAERMMFTIRNGKMDKDAGSPGQLSINELKQIQRIQAVVQSFSNFVQQESAQAIIRQDQTHSFEERSNGVPLDPQQAPASNRTGTILTLFGNAPNPKQLFSSLQIRSVGNTLGLSKGELLVDELSLPNGISAAKVEYISADDAPGPTFGDSFPAPSSLAVLQPPKAAKRPSTRDNAVKWEFKDSAQRNMKGGYTVQGLSVGNWLSYGNVEPVDAFTSPREKRKQRDRALSADEDTRSKASDAESLAREEQALFRRAYSSFAPMRDNGRAIVPEETKNLVWWHKLGRRRFDYKFALDPQLTDGAATQQQPIWSDESDEPPASEDFSRILEDLDALEDDVYNPVVESRTDTDHVLKHISDLLETLASHQRIRNSIIPTPNSTSRSSVNTAATMLSNSGRPDSPAEDEVKIYEELQRELAYLILQLPPYAVAKLDGDQLAGLGVSKLIQFNTKNVNGVMEEDHAARQAKIAAMASASAAASLAPRPPSSSTGQHYNTTAQRTPAIGQAANTRYGPSQYAARTPVPQFPRSNSGSQQPHMHPSATVPRPSYGPSTQFPRQPPSQAAHNSQASQQYYQGGPAPPSGTTYNNYGGQYQKTPQTQPPPSRFAPQQQNPPPPPNFQPRSHAAATNAVAYQTAHAQQAQYQPRTASPGKPGEYSSQPPPPSLARPPSAAGTARGSSGTPVNKASPVVNGFPVPHRAEAPAAQAQTNGH